MVTSIHSAGSTGFCSCNKLAEELEASVGDNVNIVMLGFKTTSFHVVGISIQEQNKKK